MSSATRNSSRVLQHARVVLPDRVVANSALSIEEGLIASVSPSETEQTAPPASNNLSGLTLYPGMIDVHIHGAVGVDTMAASKEDLSRVSRFLAASGVTGWMPTLVPAASGDYKNAVRAIEGLMNEQQAEVAVSTGARVLGVHYEGPFVNASQCGALHRAHFKAFGSSSDLDDLPTPQVAGAVRMMTVAPEVDGGIELIRELVGRGWIVSLGHTRADVETLDRAFAAGAHHMTHFMNAMPQLHHRAPGPVGWGLARDEVTCDLIADGVHVDPLMLRVLMRLKGSERLALISDAIAAAGQGDGDYQIWGETIAVRNGRTSNEKGSIAGSVITMLDAAKTMLSLGASEVELARMTATNPARLLGINRDCGSIEVGKRADLVGIDQDGQVKVTIIGGQLVFEF